MMKITPCVLTKMSLVSVSPLLNSKRKELVKYCFAHTLASDKAAISRETDVTH